MISCPPLPVAEARIWVEESSLRLSALLSDKQALTLYKYMMTHHDAPAFADMWSAELFVQVLGFDAMEGLRRATHGG